MIWQMRPAHAVRPEILAELKGPDPRSTGHYCGPGYCICRNKRNAWKGGAARLIDRETWKIFQETGAYGTRYWVVQGSAGGHKYRWDTTESRVSQLMGGPKDTPPPGDLPYANFDKRCFYKIAEQDRVRAWKQVIQFCERSHDTMDSEEQEAKVETQKLLWEWLKSQTANSLDSITAREWSEFREAAPRPVGGFKDTTDFEAHEQEFITNPN